MHEFRLCEIILDISDSLEKFEKKRMLENIFYFRAKPID